MNPDRSTLFSERAGFALGATLLVLFAALSALVALDKVHRPELERIEDTSAVNDPVVFALPLTSGTQAAGKLPETPVTTYLGKPFFAAGWADFEDTQMRSVKSDDAGKIPLYQQMISGAAFAPGVYARYAPGKYLELSRVPIDSASSKASDAAIPSTSTSGSNAIGQP